MSSENECLCYPFLGFLRTNAQTKGFYQLIVKKNFGIGFLKGAFKDNSISTKYLGEF